MEAFMDECRPYLEKEMMASILDDIVRITIVEAIRYSQKYTVGLRSSGQTSTH